MNKTVYFLGFTGMEFVGVFLGTLFAWFVMGVWCLLLTAAAVWIFRLRYAAWRRGVPNIFVSWRVWLSTPKKIVDKEKILSKL